MAQRDPPSQPPQAQQKSKDFMKHLLTPGIFTPYPKISRPPAQHLSDTERIIKIIGNLSVQHENVRQNKFYIISEKAKQIVATFKPELDSLEAAEAEKLSRGDETSENENEREALNREIETMIHNIGTKANSTHKTPEQFELKASSMQHSTSGDNSYKFVPRTAQTVRKEINWKLRKLIDDAAEEIDIYDTQFKKTIDWYRAELKRRGVDFPAPRTFATSSSTSSSSGTATNGSYQGYRRGSDGFVGGGSPPVLGGSGGILSSNRFAQSPLDIQGFRRGSGSEAGSTSVTGTPTGILTNKHHQSPVDQQAWKRMG